MDSSVLLAYLQAEDRAPPATFWEGVLVSSRLAEYEVWTRLHNSGAGANMKELAKILLARLALAELSPLVLERALQPFPLPLRTLDALHLATAHYLRLQDPGLTVATYDERMAESAQRLGFEVLRP